MVRKMLTDKRIRLLVLLPLILVVAAACQPLPPPDATPIPPPPAPSSPSAPTTSAASPTAVIPTKVDARAVPTVTAVPEVSEEEDCMALCHIPNPNDYIDAGAMPRPASHAGRTTCLTCHASPNQPALPATHIGRLDPSCTVCHK